MGLASVGDDAVKHASHCVSFGNQVTDFFLCARLCFFFFFAVTMVGAELDHVVRRGRTSSARKRNDRTT